MDFLHDEKMHLKIKRLCNVYLLYSIYVPLRSLNIYTLILTTAVVGLSSAMTTDFSSIDPPALRSS